MFEQTYRYRGVGVKNITLSYPPLFANTATQPTHAKFSVAQCAHPTYASALLNHTFCPPVCLFAIPIPQLLLLVKKTNPKYNNPTTESISFPSPILFLLEYIGLACTFTLPVGDPFASRPGVKTVCVCTTASTKKKETGKARKKKRVMAPTLAFESHIGEFVRRAAALSTSSFAASLEASSSSEQVYARHAFVRRDLSVNHTQGVTLGVIGAYVVVIALLWNLPYVRWVLWPFKVRLFPF